MILIGSFVVSFAIEFIWMLVSGESEIPISRLIFNFIVGLIIGSSLIFLQFIIMKFKKKPLFGFISGVVIIAALLAVIYAHTGLTTGNWNLDAKWLVIFLVVEILSLVLLFSWYKQIDLYNLKLENKKTALKSKEVK